MVVSFFPPYYNPINLCRIKVVLNIYKKNNNDTF